MRQVDDYGREFYKDYEIPPQSAEFAHWRGRLTHPEASVTDTSRHEENCVGGWIASGEWWLHCGCCKKESL